MQYQSLHFTCAKANQNPLTLPCSVQWVVVVEADNNKIGMPDRQQEIKHLVEVFLNATDDGIDVSTLNITDEKIWIAGKFYQVRQLSLSVLESFMLLYHVKCPQKIQSTF